MKKLFKWMGILIGIPIGYVLITLLLALIPVNSQKDENPAVTVYILTNGVHTDLVFPYISETFDWSRYLDTNDTPSQIQNPDWVALGWGDKGFYLDTPEWKDLKFKTAFRAVTGLSQSAMHVTYYRQMSENQNCVAIRISQENYLKMCHYVAKTFQQKENHFRLIETDQNYGPNDVFYEAKGSYHLFKTCNTWANNVLKAGHQKSALFTLFDFGIFYHYQ